MARITLKWSENQESPSEHTPIPVAGPIILLSNPDYLNSGQMDYTEDDSEDYKEEFKETVTAQKIDSFDHFAEVYCPSIFSALSRLTGLSDEDELENLTVNVLVDLWEKKEEFYHALFPGAFLYRMLLEQVFLHLEKQGNTDRISILRDILPIDPGFYLSSPARMTRIEIPKVSFLQKMRRVWRRAFSFIG